MRVIILMVGLLIAGALNPEYLMGPSTDDGEALLQAIGILTLYAFILDLWKKV